MPEYRQPPLAVAVQLAHLKRALPNGKGWLKPNRLQWDYPLQPTPLSREYLVRLIYVRDQPPKSFVIEPDLRELAKGERIPHLYDQSRVQLCLYLPDAKEWNPHMLLTNTIVPWTALWLFYFEEWLYSGEWNGGGVHPK